MRPKTSLTACFWPLFISTKNQNIMMKNIKLPYTRLRVPAVPGVYPLERDFVVYIRGLKGANKDKIHADRKFKTEEGANLYFNSLTSEERK